ncbi:hypothetical protein ACGFY6_08710 [Streptomyces sp. NPDC048387]|uniref:hypothetical protein n=1 Tax=Streptomyces sp. NPDC048387 TaxID=3365542 RepID=UPI00370FD3B7
MYDFNQHARRHTMLTDPVVTVRQIGRFDFGGRATTHIDHALVYTTPKGAYMTYLPPNRPRPRTTRLYTAVYEVDMGSHPVRAEISLPSDNDAHEFVATVELTWQVTDPAAYVQSGCRNVPRMLLGELEQSCRPVTRGFHITGSAAAEEELLTSVRAGKPLGEGSGLRADWMIRLRRDADSIEHERRLQAARHELELQRYEAQKIAFYQQHFARGGIHAWALHLARHPEDTRLALDSMEEHQLALLRSQLDQVKALLGSEGGEAHELDRTRQLMIEQINEALGPTPRAPLPTPELPELPPGYGRRPRPPADPEPEQ